MPIVKKVSEPSDVSKGEGMESKSTSSSGQSQQKSEGSTKGKTLFDATHTALFKNGVMVGELDTDLTIDFNSAERCNPGETTVCSEKYSGCKYYE